MGRNDEKAREALKELSIPEKILLVQDLWDEIAQSSHGVEITPAQREELETRIQEHETHPGTYITWEELRRELEDPQ